MKLAPRGSRLSQTFNLSSNLSTPAKSIQTIQNSVKTLVCIEGKGDPIVNQSVHLEKESDRMPILVAIVPNCTVHRTPATNTVSAILFEQEGLQSPPQRSRKTHALYSPI